MSGDFEIGEIGAKFAAIVDEVETFIDGAQARQDARLAEGKPAIVLVPRIKQVTFRMSNVDIKKGKKFLVVGRKKATKDEDVFVAEFAVDTVIIKPEGYKGQLTLFD